MVRDFRCTGCGAPLPIPKNSKGHVKCPSCKTECVIEGLVKNAEISAKENINSGISLTAPSALLHRHIVKSFYDSSSIPLDIFEKAEVIREERYCVPAYCFYCTGTASFTYEAGNIRQHKTAIDLGDRTRIETQNYMEWTQMSSTASASTTLFVSGNKEFSSQIRELYLLQDPNQLVDIEELEFPPDVVTYDYNLPQTASFNESAKPYMDALLRNNAEASLKGKTFRDLTMGGSNIQKDEVVRVFLGLYHVVYKYGGKEYSLWTTGDGQKILCDKSPSDEQRKKTFEEKKEEKERAKAAIPSAKTGLLGCGMIIFFLGFLIMVPVGIYTILQALQPEESRRGTQDIIIGISLLIGFILLYKPFSKRENAYKEKCEAVQKEIDDLQKEFDAQVPAVVQQFKNQKKALRGIYQNVSGDAAAF
jgi:hypothetical protein